MESDRFDSYTRTKHTFVRNRIRAPRPRLLRMPREQGRSEPSGSIPVSYYFPKQSLVTTPPSPLPLLSHLSSPRIKSPSLSDLEGRFDNAIYCLHSARRTFSADIFLPRIPPCTLVWRNVERFVVRSYDIVLECVFLPLYSIGAGVAVGRAVSKWTLRFDASKDTIRPEDVRTTTTTTRSARDYRPTRDGSARTRLRKELSHVPAVFLFFR